MSASEAPEGPDALHTPPSTPPQTPPVGGPPRRPTVRLMLSHPAHLLSFGGGSGLSPLMPGTVGTLWGWLVYAVLDDWWGRGPLADAYWALLLAVGWLVGCWACTRTAQALRVADPGSVVWDEVWAIWLVLWVASPLDWQGELVAVLTFRVFDMVKMGPVGWADGLFKPRPGAPIGWRQGLGIMVDDLVAAGCALLLLALAVTWRDGSPAVGILG